MSRLHESLKLLSPTPYTSIPTSDGELKSHLNNIFSHAQFLIDSVPPPDPADSDDDPSVASSKKDVTSSSARTEHSDTITELHSQWGKPVKLSAKENPLGMAVYKMSAKDKHGAWFARRSVLQGIGFARFKKALSEEFQSSLDTHGKPGEGAVRGIGAETVLEEKEISGAGHFKVMHLAAQFPGPTTPRDFVEMIMTTTDSTKYPESEDGDVPDERCYMVVSQPVSHDDMPEKKGMIRGTYESIEFIREIRSRQPKKVALSDVPGSDIKAADLEKSEKKEKNKKKDKDEEESTNDDTNVAERFEASAEEAIAQGKSVSLKPAKEKDSSSPDLLMSLNDDGEYEPNPVEWIMITRSEPGGNVPKFMVERGTPAQIVADAGAFLGWACKNHTEAGEQAKQTNGTSRNASVAHSESAVEEEHQGLLATVAAAGTAAVATVGSFVPAAITDRLGLGDHPPSYEATNHSHPARHKPVRTETVTSDVSSVSWLSAEDDFSSDDDTASKEALFHTQGLDAKLAERKAKLDAKLFEEKERISKDKTSLSEKDERKIAKAEDKHTAAITKANEQHEKDLRKYQAKHEREVKKAEEKIARERAKSIKLEEKKARDQERSVQAETIVSLRMENEKLIKEVSELKEENARLVKHVSGLPGGIVALRAMRPHAASDAVSVHSSQSTPTGVPL